MKKYFVIIQCLCILGFSVKASALSNIEVNQKVIKLFNETFPFAEKVNWQEFTETYVVHFMQGNVRTVIEYDKNGNFISSIRYYKEDMLPVNILLPVRKKYADKTIFGVTEISTEENTAYYIKMEDSKYWITVKAESNGLMQVTEKYEKQSE
jgi:hypothetical protein